MSQSLARLGVLCLVGSAAPALAADGVLEINHACATTTGCFAGDAPGYPVTIPAAGSYQLTSNLTVPASTTGIEMANGVDLDLGGFEIAGPVSCLVSCPAPGSGSGIASAVFGGNQCAVSNGKVRGFLEDGVRLGQGADVRRLHITDVARHGVNASGGSFVAENQINRIGENGIRFDPILQSLYERNTITNTGQQSVVDGKASGPNACSDQLCGTSGKKFFYLTMTAHTGATALGACAAGFHMASLSEVFEATALEYDSTRGLTRDDSGQGVPVDAGWLRNGASSSSQNNPLLSNCANWTSSAAGSFGTSANYFLPLPWQVAAVSCANAFRVWCVQD